MTGQKEQEPQTTSRSLRICCFGSSRSTTPEKYKSEAYRLGSLLASRGHVCVNGAGSDGCMGSMNDGAAASDGRIVGVMHAMFEVDGPRTHPAFRNLTDKVELVRAGGEDLQERKKLLMEGADALVVLPGGPGTWDELWEIACANNDGRASLPTVCVNVDGFYEPFQTILKRAYEDQMLYRKPNEMLHFEPTALAAIEWIESKLAKIGSEGRAPTIRKRFTEETTS